MYSWLEAIDLHVWIVAATLNSEMKRLHQNSNCYGVIWTDLLDYSNFRPSPTFAWPVPKVYFVFVHTKGPHKNWNIHILIIIKVTVPPISRKILIMYTDTNIMAQELKCIHIFTCVFFLLQFLCNTHQIHVLSCNISL